jgi:serine/threonine protein kinase
MSAPQSVAEFVQLLEKSGVVDPQDLSKYLATTSAQQGEQTPQAFARAMIERGLLTNFQSDLLLQGKWKNFILAEKYRILEPIGSGGMGRVYLCEHMAMRRRVAIKVLPKDKAASPTYMERFRREARAAAALDHPNIVQAYDISSTNNLVFIVMEYVDGTSLHELVEKFGPLAVPRACHYIAQAALGLQHAHEAGLIHRDIKPANLLLDRSGTVKILDLGLARFQHDTNDNLTAQHDRGAILGTADFLAPEQAVNSFRRRYPRGYLQLRSDLLLLAHRQKSPSPTCQCARNCSPSRRSNRHQSTRCDPKYQPSWLRSSPG